MIKRIGILTSGGDCSGLNAVIESVVKTANENGIEVYGFKMGYDGLYANDYVVLDSKNTDLIGKQGGSIIGNSNKTNLFNYITVEKDGSIKKTDVHEKALENLKKDGVDAMVIVGGDGSMTSARDFMRAGVNVVCVPKTIDNDVPSTDQSFGYATAVDRIHEALNAIRTTGASHDRIMILEVMGRGAGWLALEGGLSACANAILIPEIEYDIVHLRDFLIERYKKGEKSTVICVSEGAKPRGGEIIAQINNKYPDSVKLGGVGALLAKELEDLVAPVTGQEVRSTNLAYIQRGGDTNSFDIVLGYKYGSSAVRAILKGEFGKMVSLRGNKITLVDLVDVVGNGPTGETSKGGRHNVEPDSDLLIAAKAMGIYFGE